MRDKLADALMSPRARRSQVAPELQSIQAEPEETGTGRDARRRLHEFDGCQRAWHIRTYARLTIATPQAAGGKKSQFHDRVACDAFDITRLRSSVEGTRAIVTG
jgi:hypothetical protein